MTGVSCALLWVLRSTMPAVYQQRRKESHPGEQAWVLREKSFKKEGEGDCYKHQENMGNQEMGYTEKQKNQ